MNLLLLSNSTNAGLAYLEHAWTEVLRALNGITELAFIPFALADHDAYTAKVREAFTPHGVSVVGVHESGDPAATLRGAQAVFVGGGNSFRLLQALQKRDLMLELRKFVERGGLYMGASAGTNIAAPTIRTTNDMPIVFPESFDALGLVSFQINCHFLDADPWSTHAGETRELRLSEFHEESVAPVVAIREGAWLRVVDDGVTVGGVAVNPEYGPAKLFRRGAEPIEVEGTLAL